jgi:ADP-ribosyl-[dinitrogen reductase] hydrolase
LKRITNFAGLAQYTEFDSQLGGLVGLLIGDALGVPYEFHSPEGLPNRSKIEMELPVGFNRSHPGVRPGTWSDDGSQALCLLASLLEKGRLSLVDFSDKLLRWIDTGYMAVDRHVFDVGIQTADALDRLRDGVSPHESGGKGEMDCGNGSLMRVLPLAIWHAESDDALIRDAHLQSLPTHAHPRSQAACAFYCLVARGYLHKLPDPWSWADQRLEELYQHWPDQREGETFLQELDVLRSFPKTDTPRGTGYVVDCLWSARKAMEEDSFEDVVRSAILFGNDTDTTACVAGGLAGIRLGLSGIPKRWLEQLRGFELVEPLITQFIAKMQNDVTVGG